jgi:hypothetical protein
MWSRLSSGSGVVRFTADIPVKRFNRVLAALTRHQVWLTQAPRVIGLDSP